jgi:TatD DNase family protein
MASFFDSHAHLADSAFDEDRDAVIDRARDAGASGIICIGESIERAEAARRIAAGRPGFIWFTAGVHPHDAASFDPVADMDAIRRFVELGCVAIGECGLDYHYDHSPREHQRRAFALQLALSREAQLPVVVHTRDAEDDTRAMVTEAGKAGVRGVLHCYTGSHDLAAAALAVGWYVSFSGIVTFKKWSDEDLLRLVPDDRLLVESDAPYLAPVPNRGKRNEPSWVAHTLSRLAAARGESAESIGLRCAQNAQRLFNVASGA